jgi:hypothetical protein
MLQIRVAHRRDRSLERNIQRSAKAHRYRDRAGNSRREAHCVSWRCPLGVFLDWTSKLEEEVSIYKRGQIEALEDRPVDIFSAPDQRSRWRLYYLCTSRRFDLIMKKNWQSVGLCEYDLDQMATVHCKDCKVNYCEECDRILHKKPELRKHSRMTFEADKPLFSVESFQTFVADMKKMDKICVHGPTVSFSYQRLCTLEQKFKLYEILNARIERLSLKVKYVNIFFHYITL